MYDEYLTLPRQSYLSYLRPRSADLWIGALCACGVGSCAPQYPGSYWVDWAQAATSLRSTQPDAQACCEFCKQSPGCERSSFWEESAVNCRGFLTFDGTRISAPGATSGFGEIGP